MAKNKKTKIGVVTKTTEPNQKLVVQELRIVSPDRTIKDIGTFRQAIQHAENVLFPNRVRLYDLYRDILTDGHLKGIIKKKIDAVLNKKLYFENAAGKRVDEMDNVIKSKTFRCIIRKILETQGWGVTGFEFIPGKKICFKEIPRKHIKTDTKIISFEQYDNQTGKPYEGVSNLWVLEDEDEFGFLFECAPYSIWKRGNMGEWAQYIEIFGQPIRVIYYDAYDSKTKMELREVLDQSGSSLAMMIPKQAQFELKDGKGAANGNGELQEKFKKACDDEMSIRILGNTETTSSSKSSGYAQSKEHSKQQLEITKSDIVYVADLLNEDHFLNILKSYGLPVEGGKFIYEREIDLEELKTRKEIDAYVATQVPVGDDYWYDTYGIPKPDNYDELKKKQEEDRDAKLAQQPPVPGPGDPAPKKKQKPLKKNLSDKNKIFRLRALLADFFDPAP